MQGHFAERVGSLPKAAGMRSISSREPHLHFAGCARGDTLGVCLIPQKLWTWLSADHLASEAVSWNTCDVHSRLSETLAAHRELVIEHWMALVQGTVAPKSMPLFELVDHLPGFVDELVSALGAQGDVTVTLAAPDSATATEHGEQRLRLGFSIDAVVREYGALCSAIVATARELGIEPTAAELQCLFDSTVAGIARAVSEYARRRDAEQQRLHNEHIAFIAHELRNPLASSVIAIEMLTEAGHIPSELRAARSLAHGLRTMQELIDHALIVARSASGIELQRERVRLADLIAEAEVAAAGEADVRGITLRVELSQDISVEIDRRLLRSALSNIVRNAVKYSARGSEVEIRARLDGKHVVIEVEDECGGLASGEVEAAFAPFVRFDRRAPGFGLGLAIAKQAIDAHGGTIRVQNIPQKGCVFALEFLQQTPPR
jgi:signal transduction histidine kinase